MSLEYRIEHRLRRYIAGRERTRLYAELSIPVDMDLSVDFLKIARTIKAYRPTIRRLVDVGTHLGLFTKAISQVWPISETVCVEPTKELAEALSKSLPANTKIVQSAIGNEEGDRLFYIHPDSSMNSLVSINETAFDESWDHYKAASVTSVPIRVQTLDSLLDLLIDKQSRDILLKIDTQGSEMEVLRSGRSLLGISSTCLIEYMFWSGYDKTYDLDDLVGFMKGEGFRCAGALEPRYRKDGRAAYADMLFLPT